MCRSGEFPLSWKVSPITPVYISTQEPIGIVIPFYPEQYAIGTIWALQINIDNIDLETFKCSI